MTSAVILGNDVVVGHVGVRGPRPWRRPQRWLTVNPRADAAAGFWTGWARLAILIAPTLRDWEARGWRPMRDNDSLRLQVGRLLLDVSRLRDGG